MMCMEGTDLTTGHDKMKKLQALDDQDCNATDNLNEENPPLRRMILYPRMTEPKRHNIPLKSLQTVHSGKNRSLRKWESR